ncbi:MAG: LemA family protein [Bacilli bacterium]|nr:LemA family protein [Bacilli bacterium]
MSSFLLILLLLIIIVGLILVYYVIIYNNYQEYIIRINEVESFIDNSIRDKFDLLSKSINVIKGNVEIEEEIFPDIIKLRSRKLSSFDLDRQLVDSMNEFSRIKEEYRELKKSDAFNEIDGKLKEIEENLIAYKEYYNENITKYNRLIRNFPTNIIGKLSKYKEKTFFDGKDMMDDIDNDFKL